MPGLSSLEERRKTPEEIRTRIQAIVTHEVGEMAGTAVDLLLTSENTSMEVLESMLDQAVASAESAILSEFPNMQIQQASRTIDAMAKAAAIAIIEARLEGISDNAQVNKLLALLDYLDEPREKAA